MGEKSSAWFVWGKLYPTPLNWKGWLSICVLALIILVNAFIFKFVAHGVLDELEFLLGFVFTLIVFVIFAKIKS